MKLNASVDLGQLKRSIIREGRRFGDTGRQAVARWGVQAGRELAFQTQPFGNGGSRKTQEAAIEAGMKAVVLTVEKAQKKGKTVRVTRNGKSWNHPASRFLESPEELNQWVEAHRVGAHGHTRRLKISQVAVCRKTTFRKAFALRKRLAGKAKGPWLGAAMDIAKMQRGARQIRIGKNFMSYAQKHSAKGKAKKPLRGPFPIARLINNAAHVADSYVLKRSQITKALSMSGRKTLTWYKRAIRDR